MSKYAPLQTHLKQSNFNNLPMSFKDIEQIIGFDLPASSRTHRAWWSNNPTNNVMTKAWLDAGFMTAEVDLASEKLVFFRTQTTDPQNRKPQSPSLFGLLKGTVTIADGTDLTKPAEPNWAAVYE